MSRDPTPSQAFSRGQQGRAEASPKPPTAEISAQVSPGDTAELGRLDNRALAVLGIAVLLVWITPQAFGPVLFSPLQVEDVGAVGLAGLTATVLALACAMLGAVTAWRALRIRPLRADDGETAAAHAADAVEDKRDDVVRAAGLLAAAVVLNGLGTVAGFAGAWLPGGMFSTP